MSAIDSECIEQDDLFSFLAEEVLLKTDEEIKKSNSELERLKTDWFK